jgi:hypothetical protein
MSWTKRKASMMGWYNVHHEQCFEFNPEDANRTATPTQVATCLKELNEAWSKMS